MLLVVKALLTLVAAVGAWYALTPPQPPPRSQERVKSGGVERSFGSVVRIHALIWKVCYTALCAPPHGRLNHVYNLQCSVIASLSAELAACLFTILSSSSSSHLFSFHAQKTPLLPSLLATTVTLPPIFVLGCFATAASGALRLACYKTLGSLFTFELTLRSDHRLVTVGPYAFVRHPSYSGVVLGVLGTLLVHFGPGSWWAEAGWLGTLAGRIYAICWCAMEAYVLSSIMARAPTEDALLKKQFGAEWDEWAARVPYRVIPGVF
jgi:protein-S-isoprenylcysteine O-methyltransferase Ste14